MALSSYDRGQAFRVLERAAPALLISLLHLRSYIPRVYYSRPGSYSMGLLARWTRYYCRSSAIPPFIA